MLINKYTEQEFWDDMSVKAQDVHTKVYEFLIARKESTTHPKTVMKDDEWHTIVYNAALCAAWAVDDVLPDAIIEVMDHNLPEN
jgi:hypothetical protein